MLPRAKKRQERVEAGSLGISVLFFGIGSFLRFSLSRCRPRFQMCQPEQVVPRAPQVGHLLDFPAAHVPHFAQPARLLHQPKIGSTFLRAFWLIRSPSVSIRRSILRRASPSASSAATRSAEIGTCGVMAKSSSMVRRNAPAP